MKESRINNRKADFRDFLVRKFCSFPIFGDYNKNLHTLGTNFGLEPWPQGKPVNGPPDPC